MVISDCISDVCSSYSHHLLALRQGADAPRQRALDVGALKCVGGGFAIVDEPFRMIGVDFIEILVMDALRRVDLAQQLFMADLHPPGHIGLCRWTAKRALGRATGRVPPFAADERASAQLGLPPQRPEGRS